MKDEEWRRFELISDNPEEIANVKKLLEEKGITRQELAFILFNLRVRQGFSREDFGI